MSGVYEYWPCNWCREGKIKIWVPDDYTGEPSLCATCSKPECKEAERQRREDIKNEKERKEQESLEEIKRKKINYQNLIKEINNINVEGFIFWGDNELKEFFTEWKQKIVDEEKVYKDINSVQAESLKNLLIEKKNQVYEIRKKEEREQKNAISWDNFELFIEELKRAPNLVLEGLPEWAKMNSCDQELAKVVQKIIKEGEELKTKLSKTKRDNWKKQDKEHFRGRVVRLLDNWKTSMKVNEISIKDKDLSVIDKLVNEICGEKQENNNYSNLSQKLARGEVVNNQEIDNLPPNQITDSEKERLKKKNQTNKQKSDLQRDIHNLANKSNRTLEEESELAKKKKDLEKLNNQSPQTENDNKNDWIKPVLMIGGGIIVVGIIIYLISKNKKN